MDVLCSNELTQLFAWAQAVNWTQFSRRASHSPKSNWIRMNRAAWNQQESVKNRKNKASIAKKARSLGPKVHNNIIRIVSRIDSRSETGGLVSPRTRKLALRISQKHDQIHIPRSSTIGESPRWQIAVQCCTGELKNWRGWPKATR